MDRQNIPAPDNQSEQPGPSEEASRKLSDSIGRSQEVLMEARSIFPLTLVPAIVQVDREKVTVTYRIFIMVMQVVTVQLDDIINVTVDVGPVFGSNQIYSFSPPVRPLEVKYLRRKDAIKLKELLQGYISAKQRGVDMTVLPKSELVAKLTNLGRGAPEESA